MVPVRMRSFVGGFVLALGLVALGRPAPAVAQTLLDAQRAIEVTQAVIDRADAALACPPGDPALPCSYLAQAITLQQSARSSAASGFYRDAMALSMRARDRAYSALRTGQDATGGEFVRVSIERTDALLGRIAIIVRASASERARRQLDLAIEVQQRAKSFAVEGRPRAALSATSQARERAFRALRLTDGAAPGVPDRARAALERTDDLLRNSADVGEAPPARPAFEKARQLQERAWNRFRAGDAAKALDLTLAARDALGRALDHADRRPPPPPGEGPPPGPGPPPGR